jgi:hypothetical protein
MALNTIPYNNAEWAYRNPIGCWFAYFMRNHG